MTILTADGKPVEEVVLIVGEPCPHCAAKGIKSIVQGCFGGGAVCMKCGASR